MGGTPVKLSGMLVQAARGGAATPAAARRETLGHLLDELARSRERGTVQAHLRAQGGPRYGTDPRHPGLLVRIEPDGRRTLGRRPRLRADEGARWASGVIEDILRRLSRPAAEDWRLTSPRRSGGC